MISLRQRGSFKNTEKFLKNASSLNILSILNKYGNEGVTALASATPVKSGLTANSWYYEVSQESGGYRISWANSNVQNGTNIAVILQYGHGTRNGGYVQGRDYINPAMKPILQKIADDAWKEVTR